MDSNNSVTVETINAVTLTRRGDLVEITIGGMNLTADAVEVKDSTFCEDGQDQTQRGLHSETPVSITRDLKEFRQMIRQMEFLRQPNMGGLKFNHLGTRGVNSSPVLIQYDRKAVIVPYSALLEFVDATYDMDDTDEE